MKNTPSIRAPEAGGHIPFSVDGILNIDKPAGLTSFDVVARVKRLTHCRRVGHAGTLDPDATGVLLVCLGQATRIVEFLSQARKAYRAQIELGAATDTFDASGQVTFSGDASEVTKEQLEEVLKDFKGTVQQVPPLFSALKYRGRPLYELARAGVAMELPSRPVSIHSIDLVSWTPPAFALEVECGKGTYIRSLAHDIGRKLGCGAHLKSLKRTRSAGFHVSEAISLDEFDRAVGNGTWVECLNALDTPAVGWSAVILAGEMAKMARCGKYLDLPLPLEEALSCCSPIPSCRAYDTEGAFIGILDFDRAKRSWHPSKVFCPQH